MVAEPVPAVIAGAQIRSRAWQQHSDISHHLPQNEEASTLNTMSPSIDVHPKYIQKPSKNHPKIAPKLVQNPSKIDLRTGSGPPKSTQNRSGDPLGMPRGGQEREAHEASLGSGSGNSVGSKKSVGTNYSAFSRPA